MSGVSPIERRALEREVTLTLEEADALIAAGGWRASVGLRPGAHCRKAHGAGCLHLILGEEGACMHLDRWDPRRHLVRHVLHGVVDLKDSLPAVLARLRAGRRA